jgi:hypothetical protein
MQIWKQLEDSAMILAGTLHQRREKQTEKKGKEEAHNKEITLMRIMKSPYS